MYQHAVALRVLHYSRGVGVGLPAGGTQGNRLDGKGLAVQAGHELLGARASHKLPCRSGAVDTVIQCRAHVEGDVLSVDAATRAARRQDLCLLPGLLPTSGARTNQLVASAGSIVALLEVAGALASGGSARPVGTEQAIAQGTAVTVCTIEAACVIRVDDLRASEAAGHPAGGAGEGILHMEALAILAHDELGGTESLRKAALRSRAVHTVGEVPADVCAHRGGRSQAGRRSAAGCAAGCTATTVPLSQAERVILWDELRLLVPPSLCDGVHVPLPLKALAAWPRGNDGATHTTHARLKEACAVIQRQEIVVGGTVQAVLPSTALIVRIAREARGGGCACGSDGGHRCVGGAGR